MGGRGREISKILEQYYSNNGSKWGLVLPSSSLIKLFTITFIFIINGVTIIHRRVIDFDPKILSILS